MSRIAPLTIVAFFALFAAACEPSSAPTKPATAPVAQRETIATLRVDGMEGPQCSVLLRKAIENVAGVLRVEVSFEDRSAEITFDAAAVSLVEIRSLIKDKVGLDTRITRVVETAAGEPRATLASTAPAASCGCIGPN